MPLTDEQRRVIQARMGRSVASAPPQGPSGLPPDIAAIAARVPPGQPYLRTLGARPQMAFPMPHGQIEQELGLEAAKQQIRKMNPVVGEAIRRDFSRIDAFEGILGDLSNLAQSVRKGPIKGSYVGLGSRVTGGGEFPGVPSEESERAVTYEELRPGVAAGLYRAVTGDDRISDRDAAQRALPFVPRLGLTEKAFALRMTIVQRAIQRKRQSIRQSIRLGVSTTPSEDDDESSQAFYGAMTDALEETFND